MFAHQHVTGLHSGATRATRSRLICCALFAAATVVSVGCTPQQYAEQADRAVAKVLTEKQDFVLGQPNPFAIEYKPLAGQGVLDVEEAQLLGGKPIPIGDQPERILTLNECLTVAFRNSRRYQDRKEGLYIQALNLANARHNWSLLGGTVTGDISRTVVENGGETNSLSGETALSFAQRFANGGVVTLGAALDVASDLLGISSTSFGSLLSANVTQPLIRGAWRGFAYEDLYRQERDLAIAVLDYERFRQTFAAGIASGYYDVLQRLDQLDNEKANIVRLEQTFRRTQVQVKGGQVSRIQQDQAEQNLLRAQVRYAQSVQSYRNSLDAYKITLGLPIRANVVLPVAALLDMNDREPPAMPFMDEKALLKVGQDAVDALTAEPTGDEGKVLLDRVRAEAVAGAWERALPIAEQMAIAIAFETRPDVLVERAKVRDANRDVEIAADRFSPGLNLELGISAAGTDPRQPGRTQFHRHERFAALALDYDFDQTDNRDAYRAAQIGEARSRRNYARFLDDVRFDVRSAFRQLGQARRSYTLQQRNVVVARRRQKLAVLEQNAGQATARDVLEAEESLRTALNGLTNALVSYQNTRIEFLATLGMLTVDVDGQIQERDEPFRFDRLSRRYDHLADKATPAPADGNESGKDNDDAAADM